MGREVDIDIVRASDGADDLIAHVQAIGPFVVDHVTEFRLFNAFWNAIQDKAADNGVFFELGFGFTNKSFIHIDELKFVDGIDQQVKLILRHDLAKRTVTLIDRTFEVLPGALDLCQLKRRHIADIRLVGIVRAHATIRTKVRLNLFEILRIGVDDTFRCLRRPVVENHIWGVDEDIACAFHYTVHQ